MESSTPESPESTADESKWNDVGQNENTPAEPRATSGRWWFPYAAVLVGLTPILLFEVICHAFDWGRPTVDESLVAFENVRRLFVLDETADRYRVGENRYGYFLPTSFPATKGDHERRVFCLGGSTVQGRPYAHATAFPKWLEIALNAEASDTRWSVVNCGGVSYASYRLVPILEEILSYEPDAVVVYTGHNEFLEWDELTRPRPPGASLRSVRLLKRALPTGGDQRAARQGRAILPEEVDALLDYRGGLERYHHDVAKSAGVVSRFETHIRRMIALARAADVPIVFIDPVDDIRNTPPFKAEHDPTLSDADRESWNASMEFAARLIARGDFPMSEVALAYRNAAGFDPLHAAAWYQAGKCHAAAFEYERADDAFRRARDSDACPLRMTTPLHEALTRVVAETDVPLIDAASALNGEDRSSWLLDHVHPTIAGHQALAETVAATLHRIGVVEVRPDRARWRPRFEAHLKGLTTSYFTAGARRLERLTNWSQGRGDKLRAAPTDP